MNTKNYIGECNNCKRKFKLVHEDSCISGDIGIFGSFFIKEDEDVDGLETFKDANAFCPYCKMEDEKNNNNETDCVFGKIK